MLELNKFRSQKSEVRVSQKGFTLIELLIVVAIIAILLSLGAASYTTAQKKGRDTQRKSDLKKIQSALENYYSDGNQYPANTSGGNRFNCAGGTTSPFLIDWGAAGVQNFSCNALAGGTTNNNYLKGIPEEPISSRPDYCYISFNTTGSHQTYNLYASLENAPDSSDPGYPQPSGTASCNSETYNYQVTSND